MVGIWQYVSSGMTMAMVAAAEARAAGATVEARAAEVAGAKHLLTPCEAH